MTVWRHIYLVCSGMPGGQPYEYRSQVLPEGGTRRESPEGGSKRVGTSSDGSLETRRVNSLCIWNQSCVVWQQKA